MQNHMKKGFSCYITTKLNTKSGNARLYPAFSLSLFTNSYISVESPLVKNSDELYGN